MELQKFGIKLFFQQNGSYPYRDFIPELHRWIQNDLIPDHILIDVVDYSHIPDGPGIMLVTHEGHFTLDQEDHKPGILYMRKTDISGSFKDRFNRVLSITIQAAQLLSNNNHKFASINGATQIRAGVMRPEILIPSNTNLEVNESFNEDDLAISIGSIVRVIRDPFFGEIGKVVKLPSELMKINTETMTRVAEIAFDNEEKEIIPRANLEVILSD